MHSNPSILPGGALLAAIALLLTACGGDSNHRDDNTSGLRGQYTGVYQDQQGRPALATVTVIDEQNLTLVLRDDNDQTSRYTGVHDTQAALLTFTDQGSCEAEAATLSCRFNDIPVTLNPRSDLPATPDLSALAGAYQHRGDDGIATLNADSDGTFEVESEACHSAGRWAAAPDGRLMAISVTSSSCAEAPLNGYLKVDGLYTDGDTLEVHLPDTALAGFWFR
ncbi:Lipoprotein, putative [Alloalcanivorax dieselolei B5]|uniref:Lipoprotein, putative n=1 Tax=Alcanivorax dieselolei (strain DSM 16502 / CGMCC 1.3690 / MCCC 1A00001 / B-5) TaxID=930169 RepID=K0CEY9_ALCDB|nr:hypothetical protein [Alloalcanivorax dieselolei]AFT71203.1 Lipoprotein, putative [Alloalcanivorax dieselolei B5]GGJ93910.1 hypothetical protein GCM10007426_23590 [Alloalcanivorax dieselolei]